MSNESDREQDQRRREIQRLRSFPQTGNTSDPTPGEMTSGFGRARDKIQGLDARVAEQRGEEVSRVARGREIDIQRRRLAEEASLDARNAPDILIKELDVVNVLLQASNDLFNGRAEIDLGDLKYIPEKHYPASPGERGSYSPATTLPSYWSRRISLFNENPHFMVRVFSGAEYNVPIGVGYILQGLYPAVGEKGKDWKKIATDRHPKQKEVGEGEITDERQWAGLGIWRANIAARHIYSDRYPWPPGTKFGRLDFGRRGWGKEDHKKTLELAEARADFVDSVGECAYQVMARLKGLKP